MGGLAPGLPGHPRCPSQQLTAPHGGPQVNTAPRAPSPIGSASGFWEGWGRRQRRPWSWVMFAGGSHVRGLSSIRGFPYWFLPPVARVHFPSQVRRGGDRQASSQGLGPPREPARGCCQLGQLPSTLAAPCWGSKQIPSSLGPGGVSGLSSNSLFSMPRLRGRALGARGAQTCQPVREAGWTRGGDQGPPGHTSA